MPHGLRPLAGLVFAAMACSRRPPGASPGDFARLPLGALYLDAAGERLTLTIARAPDGSPHASLRAAEGAPAPARALTWDAASGQLRFARDVPGGHVWFQLHVVEGVARGRFARAPADAPPGPAAYRGHVTGWAESAVDRDIVPRAYDLTLAGRASARLRIDRAPGGAGFIGRIKVYATSDADSFGGEQLERDVVVTRWDGGLLRFEVAGLSMRCEARASGRAIDGRCEASGRAADLRGARVGVLAYGLSPRSAAERADHQRRTRRRIEHLMMAGNPRPARRSLERRDDPDAPPGAPYRVEELRLDYRVGDSTGAPSRRLHACLATPRSAPPPRGFPAVLAFNGHDGSAWRVLHDPDPDRGFGVPFARAGYVVLAVDVSHRPLAERGGRSQDIPDGDDPAHGNVAHPAVHDAGADSDWEEDGERAWDGMRGVDLLASLPGVDPSRLAVAGYSLGAEVAGWVAALDPRVRAAVLAGFTPDLDVILHHGNHPCWRWLHGDVREYLDVSDVHALVAPRPLVVQTGRVDPEFSRLWATYASAMQVLRRSAAAYDDAPGSLAHDLHDGAHWFDHGAGRTAGLRLAPTIEPAPARESPDWQTVVETRPGPSLVALLGSLLR